MNLFLGLLVTSVTAGPIPYQVGDRPWWLITQMHPNSLKDELMECVNTIDIYEKSDWSIGHRGSCLQYPEHTLEAYEASIRQGAGIIECDVTFTGDLELICRHAQCDLHYTTDIVTRPEMNAKCTTPFEPGVEPLCCASDFTLEEIKSLCAKMEGRGPIDGTPEEYAFSNTASWRTDLYAYPNVTCPKVVTHMESLELIREYECYYTPELKEPQVEMPFTAFDGTEYSVDDYRTQLVQDFLDAGVPPEHVYLQSFVPEDVFFWVQNFPDFGKQAVALDMTRGVSEESVDEWIDRLVSENVKIVAPPLHELVRSNLESEYRMQPSYYARQAKAAGLDIIAWTLDRSQPGLTGWYWSTVQEIEPVEGDRMNLLYVLAFEVEILGIFSDWPAVTTFFANCFNLAIRSDSTPTEPDPSPSPELPLTPPDECQSITEFVCDPANAGLLSTLCEAVGKAELGDALSSGTWTLFAPTNDAFENIPYLVPSEGLTHLLTFHVAAASEAIMSSDLGCKDLLRMGNGFDSRTICDDNQNPTVKAQRGADNFETALPTILQADYPVCNGVVHIVENVMLPNKWLSDVPINEPNAESFGDLIDGFEP